jgi:hypothetical protein
MSGIRRLAVRTLVGLLACVVLGIVVAVVAHTMHHPATSGAHPRSASSSEGASPDGSASASSGATPATNPIANQISTQLSPFLTAYFSLTKGETDAQRSALLKPMVPAAVLPDLDLTVLGPPAGSTMTATIVPGSIQVQTVPNAPDQRYVLARVKSVLTEPGADPVPVIYNTDTVWKLVGGKWIMTHFADATAGGG